MEYMVCDGLFQPACIYSFKINHKDEQTALHETKHLAKGLAAAVLGNAAIRVSVTCHVMHVIMSMSLMSKCAGSSTSPSTRTPWQETDRGAFTGTLFSLIAFSSSSLVHIL